MAWARDGDVHEPSARPERRLTAILAADVAGYSRLMERNEAGTLARLINHRKELVEPLLAEHHGRLIKLTGDGALCEFPSAVDAVECAARIQRGMGERERDLPEQDRIRFRIGINLGDVIYEEGDLYGDGVNIAARLEVLAEPGGICVSRTVHEYVRGKVPVTFQALGARRVKNISEPVEAYRVNLANVPAPRRYNMSRLRLLATVAACLLLLAMAGGWFWQWSRDRTAPALSGKPSVAVLAFDNLSGNPAQDYFSDGISDEILTALARSPKLTVIGRNSSFAYKGKSADATEISRALGVRYLLQGSVKSAGDRIRVTAQLIDARTGAHVWAEKYDRPLGDIFAVQDEITATIAARLGATIERAEVDAGRRKAPADLAAYDYYLQGRAKEQTQDKTSILEARDLFQKAIELDPDFAPAYAELAHSYYLEVALRWDPPRRAEAIAKGFELARKAVSLDPSLSFAHMTMGDLHLRRHDYDEAVRRAERAVELNPNDPENYAGLANIYSFVGRSRDAVSLMRKAIELDPNYPPRYGMYIGRAHLLAGQPAAAVPYLQDAVSRSPGFWPAHLSLASAFGHLGRPTEAKAALAAVQRYAGFTSIKAYAAGTDYKEGPEKDYVLEGLELAGMPRGDK